MLRMCGLKTVDTHRNRSDKRVRELLKEKPFLSVTIERSFVAILASMCDCLPVSSFQKQWNVVCNGMEWNVM